MSATRHVSVSIDRSADEVYKYASDPTNMADWAAGLAHSPMTQQGDHWTVTSPMGEVSIKFTPHNEFGVFDHWVTLPNGQTVYNPVRVIADGDGKSEVLFTIRQRDMTDEQFEDDTQAVANDLATLKIKLEK